MTPRIYHITPLEWEGGGVVAVACSTVWCFSVFRSGTKWGWSDGGRHRLFYDSMEAAKAAVEAEYVRRVETLLTEVK